MAGEKVQSGDLRLRLDGKTIFHAVDCSLSLTRNTTERATKDTSGVERSKSTKDWSVSFNGLVTYAGDGVGTHDFSDLFAAYNDDSDTLVDVEFLPSEGDASLKYIGEGIITDLSGNWANDEDGTVSISISGSLGSK